MLVLTRKYQEKIRIGDNITITVLRTKGKAVRLGIEAPSDVPVIRGELSFESAEAEVDADDDSTGESFCSTSRSNRRSEAMSSWATDSPHDEQPSPRDPKSPQVEHSRVKRSEVREFMPKLAAGSAPLRAVMNGRV
jgi:carbon storage regulator CsrA